MCCKRFIMMVLAGFAFSFGYDFMVHEMLLSSAYEATASLWRSPEEMQQLCTFAMIFKFLIVGVLAFIFTRNYEGKGICEGARFGLYLGLFSGLSQAMMYIYLPIPMVLAGAWFVAALVYMVILGVVFSLICKCKRSGGDCCEKKEECCDTGS